MEKKISVIVPVYNGEDTIRECLDSIFLSDYKNFEVIVVNDHSDDRSLEFAQRYPCEIINLPERSGPAFARNKGLSLAEGEIAAFLDSDCIAPKDWLTKINAKIVPDIAGVGGRYIFPKNFNLIFAICLIWWDLKNIFYKKPRGLISFSGGNCAFRKQILLKERRKRELVYCHKRVGGEDTIMCSELENFGKLIYAPDLPVVHNKKCTLFNILKQSMAIGDSGIMVSALCTKSLVKEPHRLYKTFIYLFSILLFFLLPLTAIVRIRLIYFYLLIFYVILQLPFIFLASNFLGTWGYVLFSPFIIFATDICHFFGQVNRIRVIFTKFLKSIIWHIRFIINIIKPSGLLKLFFFVTKKCNADCRFCFNKGNGQIGADGDLSLGEVKNITSKINFLPELTITGGEPFLREDISQICRLFYFNCGTRVISIVTNGTRPPEIEEAVERALIECEQLNLSVMVALDDIGERHDRIKGFPCYAKAAETLRRLNNLQGRFPRLSLGINTILIEENTERIEEILTYFSDNFRFERQYLNLLRQPACASIEPKFISIDRYFDLLKNRTFSPRAGDNHNSSIKKVFYQAFLEYCCDTSLKAFKLKKSEEPCLAGQNFFVIDNNGDILPCELLYEKLGNLQEAQYDFQQIKNSRKVKAYRAKIINANCYCQWPCALAIDGRSRIRSVLKILKYAINIKLK